MLRIFLFCFPAVAHGQSGLQIKRITEINETNATESEYLEPDPMYDYYDELMNTSNTSYEAYPVMRLEKRGGWGVGGDKLWGSGRGVEDINSGNVGYYNAGMRGARNRCGGSSCALIVNPPGHRSIDKFHIHFVHYHSYGSSLKHRLEKKVCGRSGWQRGGLPCHGKAIFSSGFPGVFSLAMSGGGLRHASVIAWPASCGGKGTIVQLAYGCSIEHQIRGDYNPAYR